MDLFSKVLKRFYTVNYAILDYHSTELLCIHYNGLAVVSFLLQLCIALDIQ